MQVYLGSLQVSRILGIQSSYFSGVVP